MLTNITLSDLIALRQHLTAFVQEPIPFDADEYGRLLQQQQDRWKLVDKELSERVEKIFEK